MGEESCIQIVDWELHYENNRTRELKKLAWVPMPNRHDGDGYTQLLDHPNGAAHFGTWCALVEVASRCDVRGTLLRDGKKPHNADSLSRMTRIPVEVWDEALPRLVSIGWIRYYTISQEGAASPQEGAVIPQEGALNERKNERKKAAREEPPAAAAFSLTALKKRLADAVILTTPAELEAVYAQLVAQSADCDAFVSWALAKAAKARNPSSWFVKGLREWNYIEKWRAEGSPAKPIEPAPYVPIEPHLSTAEDDAEVERLAAETRAKLHMVDPPAEVEGAKNELDAIPF